MSVRRHRRWGLATNPKAPEDWRTPGRFALFASRRTTSAAGRFRIELILLLILILILIF
jgi:hypothetical protein